MTNERENINLTGEELRQMLQVFGYTQVFFAEYCGVNPNTIKKQVLNDQIGRRYAESLLELVGDEAYNQELRVIRRKNELRGNNLNYLLNELFDEANGELTINEFLLKIGKK